VRDRWHQPARAALVPLLGEILAVEDPDVLGAFLSGAGPSVALLATREFGRLEQVLSAMYAAKGLAVTVRTLDVHRAGV
jgi:homoserine kinase